MFFEAVLYKEEEYVIVRRTDGGILAGSRAELIRVFGVVVLLDVCVGRSTS